MCVHFFVYGPYTTLFEGKGRDRGRGEGPHPGPDGGGSCWSLATLSDAEEYLEGLPTSEGKGGVHSPPPQAPPGPWGSPSGGRQHLPPPQLTCGRMTLRGEGLPSRDFSPSTPLSLLHALSLTRGAHHRPSPHADPSAALFTLGFWLRESTALTRAPLATDQPPQPQENHLYLQVTRDYLWRKDTARKRVGV